jgi:hypothetical protein
VYSTWFRSDIQKIQKKKKDHLIFINFGVKKFTIKNIQKKKFDVWMLLSPRSHGMKSSNVLRLIYNKVTSRSYNYFLKFSYFYFLRNWFSQVCQKLQSLVQKPQGILGVKCKLVHFVSLDLPLVSPILNRVIQKGSKSFWFLWWVFYLN